MEKTYPIQSYDASTTGDWSDELIMLVNLTGNHGGIQAGTDVWGEGTREIALTYADDLKDYLRSAGIPVI